MLELGGIPQGDYAPVPWINGSRGWAAWIETDGHGARFELGDEVVLSTRRAAGPLKVHFFTHPTAFARLRAFLTLTGLPPVLPEWGYGHWKSRDFYDYQHDAEADFDGYREHGLPLDAMVLDSPWETQYNTWAFNPHQFPDPEGMIGRWRADGVRTVVWIAPWVNLESRDGQYPPDKASAALHAEPAPNYEPEMFVREGDEPFVTRWWMGSGSPVDFTNPRAEEWWREQAKNVLRLGVQGIKADDGEGWYIPDDARFADSGPGGRCPSLESRFTHGVTHTTVRTPCSRMRAISPGASGNWCGLNSHVLYWVSHGESSTIASSGRPCSR